MNKKRLLFALLIVPFLFSYASEEVFFTFGSDVSTSYIFRGQLPAAKQPSFGLNFSAFFYNLNINISQWFVNSISHPGDYRELGTMVSYYHYFSDRFIGSAGMTLYLLPDVAQTPLANTEASITFADMNSFIPYFIEAYYDFVLKSMYVKLLAGYSFDAFIPVNLTLASGFDLLSYNRYGRNNPAGLSNIGLSVSTYFSLKNWQITPKASLFFLNSLNSTILPQVNVNLSYSF